MQDLGTSGGNSTARGINDSGQVVGYSDTSAGDRRAFLWEDGVMTDLGTLVPTGSGWTLTEAHGINDLGQIVGTGVHNGVVRPFVLTPSGLDTTAPSGRVSINNGAAYTNSTSVRLTLTATDPSPSSGITAMRFSNDGATWSAWTSYTGTAIWTLGSGTTADRTVYAQFRDGEGHVSPPASDSIKLDTTAPVAKAPVYHLFAPSRLGSVAVPVKVSWPVATDTGGSGVARYELQQKKGLGAWTLVRLPSALARSIVLSVSPGYSYQFRVRAVDRAGNATYWKAGTNSIIGAYNENSTATVGKITYTGTWPRVALSGAYGGYVRYASYSGKKATFSFSGRSVAWATTVGPNRGKADIYIDGTRVRTVDLYASSYGTRRIVYTRAWVATGSHTLEVRVLGTKNSSSTGTRVDVDAFATLR